MLSLLSRRSNCLCTLLRLLRPAWNCTAPSKSSITHCGGSGGVRVLAGSVEQAKNSFRLHADRVSLPRALPLLREGKQGDGEAGKKKAERSRQRRGRQKGTQAESGKNAGSKREGARQFKSKARQGKHTRILFHPHIHQRIKFYEVGGILDISSTSHRTLAHSPSPSSLSSSQTLAVLALPSTHPLQPKPRKLAIMVSTVIQSREG